jgi:TRAP-type C4-dicarboxylate transport system permease small subunit
VTDGERNSGARPDGLRSSVGTVWRRIVDGLGATGTLLIGVLMLVIFADVVARNLLGSSLPLVSELGALTLVMIVYLQLPTTIRHNRLARTDIFIAPLSRKRPRAAALLTLIFNLVGAATVCGIAWATIRILEKDMASREYIGVTGVATFPTWPFRALIFVGVAIAAIQFLIQSYQAARAFARGTNGTLK